MTKKIFYFITSVGIILLLNSCTTYTIPVESFKRQFMGLDSSTYVYVVTRTPWGEKVKYKTFPIDYVDCVDKKGNSIKLEKIPSLEIRFTDSNDRKTVFYFDRISVTDTVVTGIESWILLIRKTIAVNKIKKIEIQDGRKSYKYIHE